MRTIRRGLAVAAAIAGACVALAIPATAEPPSGTYSATVIDGAGSLTVGAVDSFTLTPCGPDCVHYQNQGSVGADLHPRGDSWAGTYVRASGQSCNLTLDNAMIFTYACPAATYRWQLVKNG